MQTLRNEVHSEITLALQSAQKGNDVSDDLCDELGDYWEDVQDCNDIKLQTAYNIARGGISCTAQQQVIILQYALLVINNIV